jgi:hypothetical protein
MDNGDDNDDDGSPFSMHGDDDKGDDNADDGSPPSMDKGDDDPQPPE